MNTKKLFIGGIVGGIVYFLLGWLIYGKLLMSYFMEHHGLATDADRAQPIFRYLAIGNLLMGFLLSYIFVKGKVSSLGGGFVTGGIVGLLMGSSTDAIVYATSTVMSKSGILADVIAFTVMSAIVGAIIGAVSGKD
jgi:hypothetical protein